MSGHVHDEIQMAWMLAAVYKMTSSTLTLLYDRVVGLRST